MSSPITPRITGFVTCDREQYRPLINAISNGSARDIETYLQKGKPLITTEGKVVMITVKTGEYTSESLTFLEYALLSAPRINFCEIALPILQTYPILAVFGNPMSELMDRVSVPSRIEEEARPIIQDIFRALLLHGAKLHTPKPDPLLELAMYPHLADVFFPIIKEYIATAFKPRVCSEIRAMQILPQQEKREPVLPQQKEIRMLSREEIIETIASYLPVKTALETCLSLDINKERLKYGPVYIPSLGVRIASKDRTEFTYLPALGIAVETNNLAAIPHLMDLGADPSEKVRNTDRQWVTILETASPKARALMEERMPKTPEKDAIV